MRLVERGAELSAGMPAPRLAVRAVMDGQVANPNPNPDLS